MSKQVAEKPSAPMGTIVRDTVKGVGWTRSVSVRLWFWRREAVQKCDFLDLNAIHAVFLVSRRVAEKFR